MNCFTFAFTWYDRSNGWEGIRVEFTVDAGAWFLWGTNNKRGIRMIDHCCGHNTESIATLATARTGKRSRNRAELNELLSSDQVH